MKANKNKKFYARIAAVTITHDCFACIFAQMISFLKKKHRHTFTHISFFLHFLHSIHSDASCSIKMKLKVRYAHYRRTKLCKTFHVISGLLLKSLSKFFFHSSYLVLVFSDTHFLLCSIHIEYKYFIQYNNASRKNLRKNLFSQLRELSGARANKKWLKSLVIICNFARSTIEVVELTVFSFFLSANFLLFYVCAMMKTKNISTDLRLFEAKIYLLTRRNKNFFFEWSSDLVSNK